MATEYGALLHDHIYNGDGSPKYVGTLDENRSTNFQSVLPWVDAVVDRAKQSTAEFAAAVDKLPVFEAPKPVEKKARKIFDHYDVDGTGALGFDEVLLGVKALGITATAAEVRPIFDEADKDKSGAIEMHEFAGICEGVANMRQGRAADGARLLQAASALHAQAHSEPLVLVAEGEVPTLIRCAGSGHRAVEQLGLAALAAVAEAPQADCAAAIVSRGSAFGAVLSKLNTLECGLPSVRQGARLLAALCREASEAKEMGTRRGIRLRLYEHAAPLLHGPFGELCLACCDQGDVQTAQHISHVLQAFAMENELLPKLCTDGGGASLRLACSLAGRCQDGFTRAACVETIAAAAEDGEHTWKLIGFNAIPPLLLASSLPQSPGEPPCADTASRALKSLRYDGLWKGVAGVDPLEDVRRRGGVGIASARK